MNTFFYERINSPRARDTIYQEAEDAFKNQVDDASGVHGIWQGEFWGKWIIGASRVCAITGNEELRDFIGKAAHRLMTYQRADGYLGTYRDPMNVFPADPEKTKPVMGWPCNWNWNIWCQKYTLWGLLEAWQATEDKAILKAAERLADHLLGLLENNKIQLAETGTFAGLPSCSILKPMVLLYQATGREAYLEFAKAIAHDWMRDDNRIPNLINNALSGVPVHEWYENAPTWAKAYEMMSCFDGILALYKVTGESILLEAAEQFHALLKTHELNILFSVGFNDIFMNAAPQVNAITEPCDVIHWMRLCSELFALTKNKAYMDDFELAFYNAFMAGVYRDGRWGARGVRGHGHHYTVAEQAKFKYNHCCVNNVPRGFVNAAQTMVMTSADTVYVSLYTDFNTSIAVEAGEIDLSVSGDYLSSGRVTLTFNAKVARTVNVKLRIPGWATSSAFTIAGKHVEGGTADWCDVTLDAGVTEVEMKLDRQLEIRRHAVPASPSAWHEQRWIAREENMTGLFLEDEQKTLVYGPLLLAKSKYLGTREADLLGASVPNDAACSLKPIRSDQVWCAFEATVASKGNAVTLPVCDYATAGNADLSTEPLFFSIYF
jgi:DUF1680 family protein